MALVRIPRIRADHESIRIRLEHPDCGRRGTPLFAPSNFVRVYVKSVAVHCPHDWAILIETGRIPSYLTDRVWMLACIHTPFNSTLGPVLGELRETRRQTLARSSLTERRKTFMHRR